MKTAIDNLSLGQRGCWQYLRLYLVAILLLFGNIICHAQMFSVKVVGISDGDSFTVINNDHLQLKIRLFGIDAPEKKQDYGSKSKEYLSSLIFGRQITVNVQSQDKWGRYLAYVFTPEGEDVSLLMLRAGYAWHFKRYDSSDAYKQAENMARREKRGLWFGSNPVPPWDFRKHNK